MEVLSNQQMKEIVGGDYHLGSCVIQCDAGGSYSTISCDQTDADTICGIYNGDGDFATHCQCQYVE